ncbi:helix-turn-helix domain-containing protein [uncultured Lacticaseibacillus sp.]|uniref:helix-turn-helix domain-containing protein n=1 Tax=uncultured Lacticaseibacillus sp. TaxID=2775882 RepID=UPI002594BAF3|nr:helix-turn-helix domain-containing protein [uncultured Lacticaseibacillus sp.]
MAQAEQAELALPDVFEQLLDKKIDDRVAAILSVSTAKTPGNDTPIWFNIQDAARYANVSVGTMRKWVYRLGLPMTVQGKVKRIARTDIDSFLANRK